MNVNSELLVAEISLLVLKKKKKGNKAEVKVEYVLI